MFKEKRFGVRSKMPKRFKKTIRRFGKGMISIP